MQSLLISPNVSSRCQLSIVLLRRCFPCRNGTTSTTVKCAVRERNAEVLRARLLYQSRKRGIRENDILIGGFAEQHLATMVEHELEQYDQIINGQHTEWDLFHYFSGAKEAPSELDKNGVFRRMCHHFNTAKKPVQSS